MSASAGIYGVSPPQRERIDQPWRRDWWRRNAPRQALGAGLCLALMGVLVCRLAVTSAKTSQPVGPNGFEDGLAFFDSFSEPSVACAIIRQEAERLLQDYRQHADQEEDSQAPHARVGVKPATQPGTDQGSDPLAPSGNRFGLQASLIQALSGLDAQVQDVELSLSRKLLFVYFNQQLWNEFVDRYLQLVREGPGRYDTVLYARCVLDCSLKCGRTEEVVDVLQHIIRFHPELKTAAKLKDVLAEWKTENSTSLEVGRQ